MLGQSVDKTLFEMITAAPRVATKVPMPRIAHGRATIASGEDRSVPVNRSVMFLRVMVTVSSGLLFGFRGVAVIKGLSKVRDYFYKDDDCCGVDKRAHDK